VDVNQQRVERVLEQGLERGHPRPPVVEVKPLADGNLFTP
jgi:hypothetical protein